MGKAAHLQIGRRHWSSRGIASAAARGEAEDWVGWVAAEVGAAAAVPEEAVAGTAGTAAAAVASPTRIVSWCQPKARRTSGDRWN